MLRKTISALRDFLKDEQGVTTLEYGILAAGVAVVIGAIVSTDGVFNETIEELFNRVLEALPTTSSGSD